MRPVSRANRYQAVYAPQTVVATQSATAAAPSASPLRSGLSIDTSVPSPVSAAVQYSDEQDAIIHCPARNIVVRAFAGTGKTTTAVGFAAARKDKRFLYVAFGKQIQMEASRRFGSNTVCQTSHSLAWGAVGRHYKERLARAWPAYLLANEAGLKNVRFAAITQSILKSFFHSADRDLLPSHGYQCVADFRAQEHEVHECLSEAKKIWKRMQDRTDRISVPDDAYLKMWSLTNPKLNFDYIIFDEAQDSNPVTSSVIRAQPHANMLYIGDRHQSIYAFRGAVNAMDDLGDSAKILNLSKTWRFGPKTAEVANLMLGELKAEPLKIIGMGQDAPYIKGACITKLARTNAQLFKDAAQRRGEGIHWVGRASSYNLGRMLEAYYLYANKRDLLKDPFLRHFSSWGEMQAYAEEARDPEVRVMAAIVDEFRHEIPTLVQQIKNNEVENAADASLVLTTAHKSKGLDWDYVQIADDFEILAETEADLALDSKATINEQEINLLYVAATRSRKKLQLNTETQNWLRDLPAHRQARALAAQKEARLQHNKYGVEA